MAARIGHYELIDRFAMGGVAEIYRARDVRNDEIVVIKRLRTDIEFDPEKHAGFIRELQLAMMCTHKNLIRGIEKGSANGYDYGVMEYVDGRDLQQIIAAARQKKAKVPWMYAVYIACEILDGLDFAWRLKDNNGVQLGLVHRDLSPKNVFIKFDGQVRVGDFGSSLATQTERADAVVGTLGYMSPEQARMESLDQRSDLFATGLILYELLAGEPAFDIEGKKDQVVVKSHQKGAIKPMPADLPEDLRLVVEIATAPDPDDRYPTAKDMKKGLVATDFGPDHETPAGLARLVEKLFGG